MNESQITVQGWLGADVRTRQAGDAIVASFRLACTPRRLNRATGEWGDATTQWFTVNAWRALGEHCAASLRRGDPVVVHGRLNASTWVSSAGVEMTSFEIDAIAVGHDLNRGTTHFTKVHAPRPQATEETTTSVAEPPPFAAPARDEEAAA